MAGKPNVVTDCQGCLAPLHPMERGYWTVCFPCTRARHKAVLARGRCVCHARERRPRQVSNGSRAWIACDRCLGSIRQLS